MTCHEVAMLGDVYLDGELALEDRSELERHLDACPPCRAHVEHERGVHGALRAALRRIPLAAPADLEARLAAVVRSPGSGRAGGWRIALALGGLAAAAGLALWFRGRAPDEETSLVAAIVESHRRELPVEVASPNPEAVRTWFRGKVDVPVTPPRPRRGGAQLVGGRVARVREKDAAQLVYDVGGHRVSVLIFDPGGLRMEAPQRRRVRDLDVLMGDRRGYRVALFENRGLGYAVAGEGNDAELLDFVNATLSGP